jgi:hypothetical protein
MAITNACPGTGKAPTRRRVTPRDLGSKYGGRTMGCCPDEGCDVLVLKNGKLAKHEIDSGSFLRAIS